MVGLLKRIFHAFLRLTLQIIEQIARGSNVRDFASMPVLVRSIQRDRARPASASSAKRSTSAAVPNRWSVVPVSTHLTVAHGSADSSPSPLSTVPKFAPWGT